MGLLMVHSYVTINFLYDGRFISQKRLPRVHAALPWVIYPIVLFGSVIYMVTENSKMMKVLDRKYTPLWLEISKKI
jgi:hypothetical protein